MEKYRHYCTHCEEEKDFIYSNSTLLFGRDRVDYYSCECGETYTKSQLEKEVK